MSLTLILFFIDILPGTDHWQEREEELNSEKKLPVRFGFEKGQFIKTCFTICFQNQPTMIPNHDLKNQ